MSMSLARMCRGYRPSYIGRAKELFGIEQKAALERAGGGLTRWGSRSVHSAKTNPGAKIAKRLALYRSMATTTPVGATAGKLRQQ